MPIKLNSTGGGSVTLDVPSMSTANTLVLPAKSGNIITSADSGTVTQAMLGSNVVGNGPAFHAYTLSQTFSNSTWQKLNLNLELYDTANCFDSTTNYRFTPNVAGYYQFSSTLAFNGASSGAAGIDIYKNGSAFLSGGGIPNNQNVGGRCHVSGLIYLNGSTDYVEIYGWQNSGGNLTIQSGTNYLTGFLARAA